MNWKHLTNNPPLHDCTLLVADIAEGIKYGYVWVCEYKAQEKTVRPLHRDEPTKLENIRVEYHYINLDEIK